MSRFVPLCRLWRTTRPWPAARALRGWCDDFGGSFVLAWASWFATRRRGIGKRQCLGRVRGRGVDRRLLLLTGCRTFSVRRGPQHDGPVHQFDVEPVATVQAKLLPQGGGQRNPPLIVEFERRHDRGLPRLYAGARDNTADVTAGVDINIVPCCSMGNWQKLGNQLRPWHRLSRPIAARGRVSYCII